MMLNPSALRTRCVCV
ncbi:hypothetical protein AGR7B_Lc40026 [Agrobacterium deltaense RV3]|nr:hypothetical protein AGR7B_Lc40026 [Agrobacterium deltaense RV3]